MKRAVAHVMAALVVSGPATASPWEMLGRCALPSLSTVDLKTMLAADGWAPLREDAALNPTLDPAAPTDLAVIATIVGTFFARDLTEIALRDAVKAHLDNPYTTFFSAGDARAFAKDDALFQINDRDDGRVCRYFGPASAAEGQPVGTVVPGPAERLKKHLGVEMSDQMHVEVLVVRIE